MARFDREYLYNLTEELEAVIRLPVEEQAERFKLRYVFSLGEDVFAIDDRVSMFLAELNPGTQNFDYNDPKLTKFLEDCQVTFESFLVRNQQFNILSPNPKRQKLSFVEFLLYDYKNMILGDYAKRWKLSKKAMKKVMQNTDHVAQAVYSEFLEQPPIGINLELDQHTKDERETRVNHRTRVTQLEQIVKDSEGKAVRSVGDKKAIAELEILRQTDIEDRLTYIKTQIVKLSRKVKAKQKEALKQLYEHGTLDMSAMKNGARKEPVRDVPERKYISTGDNYVLPPGWEEYIDDNTGAPYYHHPESGTTQWVRP